MLYLHTGTPLGHTVAAVFCDARAPSRRPPLCFFPPSFPFLLPSVQVVNTLLRWGSAPDVACREPGEKAYTPLHRAALGGHGEAARVLIKAGADKDARTGGSGATALHLAARKVGEYSLVVTRVLCFVHHLFLVWGWESAGLGGAVNSSVENVGFRPPHSWSSQRTWLATAGA